MELNFFLNRLFLIATVVALFIFLVFVFHFIFKDEVGGGLAQLNAQTTVLLEQKKTDAVGFPVRLKIPSISINAPVEYVGLTSKGAMDTPVGVANVAWFNKGPRPGEVGSAVIDGHFGYKNNKPAVFDNLHKLKKGDKLYIEDGKGATISFVVRELKSYSRDADALDVFTSNDGKSHLNLITCIGDWDVANKTHSNRLVVFTDKEI